MPKKDEIGSKENLNMDIKHALSLLTDPGMSTRWAGAELKFWRQTPYIEVSYEGRHMSGGTTHTYHLSQECASQLIAQGFVIGRARLGYRDEHCFVISSRGTEQLHTWEQEDRGRARELILASTDVPLGFCHTTLRYRKRDSIEWDDPRGDGLFFADAWGHCFYVFLDTSEVVYQFKDEYRTKFPIDDFAPAGEVFTDLGRGYIFESTSQGLRRIFFPRENHVIEERL